MTTVADSISRQIEEGRTAQRILDAGESFFRAREQQCLKEMLGWFRLLKDGVGQNDPHIAMRFIAAFSEARALIEELDQRVDLGTKAMGKFMEQQGATHLASLEGVGNGA